MSPSLPPLYFSSLDVVSSTTTVGDSPRTTSSSRSLQIPSEIVHKCLAEYSDWGDLAKLACVQKSWSNILRDAARPRQTNKTRTCDDRRNSTTASGASSSSSSSSWELAQAFMNGTHGLSSNPRRGIWVLHQIAGSTQPPSTTAESTNTNDNTKRDVVVDDDDDDHGLAPAAMKELASCYWNGNGVDADAGTGLAWMVSAYDACGDADAAYRVAMVYEHGRHGVGADVVAAARWFRAAAGGGHVESMAELALCYELGCGLEQSDALALEWYLLAAHRGHVHAQYSVAEIFEEARGVPQSDEEACLWYYRAAAEGDEDSRRALLRLSDVARIVLPGGVLNRLPGNRDA